MQVEPGADVGVDAPELSDELTTAMYQMAQLARLRALDLQRVIETEIFDERAALVRDLIADQMELNQLHLERG